MIPKLYILIHMWKGAPYVAAITSLWHYNYLRLYKYKLRVRFEPSTGYICYNVLVIKSLSVIFAMTVDFGSIMFSTNQTDLSLLRIIQYCSQWYFNTKNIIVLKLHYRTNRVRFPDCNVTHSPLRWVFEII